MTLFMIFKNLAQINTNEFNLFNNKFEYIEFYLTPNADDCYKEQLKREPHCS